MTTLDDAYGHVAHWQGETFKTPTLDGAVRHMVKEAKEVEHASQLMIPRDDSGFDEEVADVFFMLVQICELRGTDLADEVMKKLAKNKQRSWPDKPAADGCYHHSLGVGDKVRIMKGEPHMKLGHIAEVDETKFKGDRGAYVELATGGCRWFMFSELERA